MKKSIILIVLLVTVLLLSGCNSAKQASEPETSGKTTVEKELLEVRLPDIYDPTITYTPYIAVVKGFYEKAGIKPIFTGIVGTGQMVPAVLSKDIDAGNLHVNRLVAGRAAGGKLKAVVAGSETTEQFPHMEFVALDNGKINEPADLYGKRFGIVGYGGCNEYTPYEYLRKFAGEESPKGKIEIIVVQAGTEEQLLRSGEIDLAGYHGHPEAVFNNGGVKTVFDDYEVWGTEGGATPWYFHEDFIRDNPETVRRFVAAHAEAINWINEHKEEAKKIQSEYAKVPLEKVTIQQGAKDGIITESSTSIWLDILRRNGDLQSEVKVEDCYTNEFNPNSPDYRFK